MSKIVPTVSYCPFAFVFEFDSKLRNDKVLGRIYSRYEHMRKRYLDALEGYAEDDDAATDWLESNTARYNSEMADLCDQFSARLCELGLSFLC